MTTKERLLKKYESPARAQRTAPTAKSMATSLES